MIFGNSYIDVFKKSFLSKGEFFKLFIPLLLTGAGFFIFSSVFAYDSSNGHRSLTYEIAQFYNLNYDQKLTNEEIESLVLGAKEEDTPPRWVNHFYNPETGEGWKAERLGSIPSDLLLQFSHFALSSRKPLSAKNWAKNRSAQADYGNYLGDQTWQRAIELYLESKKSEAYKALGHILHLIEDMTVPDHTRGDTHAGLIGDKGSPYENWVKEYTRDKVGKLSTAENLYQQGVKPKNLPILEDYFDLNANYSSKNFFSEDTISGELPKINNIKTIVDEKYEIKELYTRDNAGSYLVGLIKFYANENLTIKTTADERILNNYFQRLSRQAVISGAGIINLFHQEVAEQAKLAPKITKKETNSPSKIFSPFGELAKLNKQVTEFVSGAQKFVSDTFSLAKTQTVVDINDLKDKGQKTQKQKESASNPPAAQKQEKSSAPPPPRPAQESNEPRSTPTRPQPQPQSSPQLQPQQTNELLYVSRVIDGDTVTLNNGRDLRLIGIDAPETGDPCFAESKYKLENLVLGKTITIEKDKSDQDKYGRQLGYLYINGVLVNAEMLKSGFAKVMTVPPDTKYYYAFRALEDEAKFFSAGCLYQKTKKPNPAPSPNLNNTETPSNTSTSGGSSYASPDQPKLNQTNTENLTANLSNTASANNTPSNNSATSASSTTDNSSTSSTSTPQTDNTSSTSTPSSDTSSTSTPQFDTSTTSTPSSDTSTTSTPPTDNTSSTSTPPTEPDETSPVSQDKILISEIQLAGATSDDEFIELYNPNNRSVALDGWSVQYRGSASKNFSKKNFSSGAVIPAYGFYLIGHKNYSGTTTANMTHSAFSLSAQGGTIFLVRDKNLLKTGAEETISDKAAYLSAAKTDDTVLFPETQEINTSNLAVGGSLERKANASSTSETMAQGGINETDGNSLDTDHNSNDFVLQFFSFPQNTSSTAEDPTNQHYPQPQNEPQEDESDGEEDEEDESQDESEDEPQDEPPQDEPSNNNGEEKIVCQIPTYEDHPQNNERSPEVDTEKRKLVEEFPIFLPNLPDQTVTLARNKTYYIDGIDDAYVPPAYKLIIEEGVILKFNKWRRDTWTYFPLHLRVAGDLEINGTKNNPVIFTTFRDDEHGAPLEIQNTNPAPGDWGSLQIESSAGKTIKIEYAKLFYGGGFNGNGNQAGGAIYLNASEADIIEISNVEVYHSQSGLYSRARPSIEPKILQSHFEYNQIWGLQTDTEPTTKPNLKLVGNTFKCNGYSKLSGTTGGVNINGDPTGVTLRNNNFLGNQTTGLYFYNEKDQTMEARENYWNSSTGPLHQTANPQGTGDIILGKVNFSPWSTKPNEKF